MLDDERSNQEIEVGADGDSLRYWQAKEAMRHAELRLAAQAATLQAFEARATSLLGWILAILTTISGFALVTLNAQREVLAAALLIAILPAGCAVIQVSGIIWPKAWCVPGYEPSDVTSECANELQQVEFLLSGYGAGIRENAQFLSQAGQRVRLAWLWLVLTPLAAAAAGLIVSAAGY